MRGDFCHAPGKCHSCAAVPQVSLPLTMPLSPHQVSELLLQDRMGFPEYSMGPSRLGWLVNLNTVGATGGAHCAGMSSDTMGAWVCRTILTFSAPCPHRFKCGTRTAMR